MALETLKTSWRPVFAWAFIGFFVVTGITVLAMLWLGMEKLDAASGILITMLGMGGAVTGVYTAGRTYEKRHGKDRVPDEVPAAVTGETDGLGD